MEKFLLQEICGNKLREGKPPEISFELIKDIFQGKSRMFTIKMELPPIRVAVFTMHIKESRARVRKPNSGSKIMAGHHRSRREY
jgi:hypothetical protein